MDEQPKDDDNNVVSLVPKQDEPDLTRIDASVRFGGEDNTRLTISLHEKAVRLSLENEDTKWWVSGGPDRMEYIAREILKRCQYLR